MSMSTACAPLGTLVTLTATSTAGCQAESVADVALGDASALAKYAKAVAGSWAAAPAVSKTVPSTTHSGPNVNVVGLPVMTRFALEVHAKMRPCAASAGRSGEVTSTDDRMADESSS